MKPTIYVVGIGPGRASEMTPRAREAILGSKAVFGYKAYTALISDLLEGKEVYSSPMKSEVDRCRGALGRAREGCDVALISSGDPNVYGMGSLMLEVAGPADDVNIEIVGGLTAALSGSALLGAPISGDFAVISLSDLMTPWQAIEKRLKGASLGDFAIALYNPSSQKRADRLSRACEIILECQKPETPCGVARNIGRQGEEAYVLTLGELKEAKLDMFSIAFVGNSQSRIESGRIITPRGYAVESL